MRLTWTGQYIHAAPWSVSSQGHTDVSHGCTNISTANAKWIYENSLVGTPVNVKNTPQVAAGNGWTDWNVTWDDFIKGSALPVRPDTTQKAEARASAFLLLGVADGT